MACSFDTGVGIAPGGGAAGRDFATFPLLDQGIGRAAIGEAAGRCQDQSGTNCEGIPARGTSANGTVTSHDFLPFGIELP